MCLCAGEKEGIISFQLCSSFKVLQVLSRPEYQVPFYIIIYISVCVCVCVLMYVCFVSLQANTGKIEGNPLSEIEQIVRMSRVSSAVVLCCSSSLSSELTTFEPFGQNRNNTSPTAVWMAV